MKDIIKGHQVRVYLKDQTLSALGELAEVSGIPQTTMATVLLTAAIEAVRRSGDGISFPLLFKLDASPRVPEQVKPPAKSRV